MIEVCIRNGLSYCVLVFGNSQLSSRLANPSRKSLHRNIYVCLKHKQLTCGLYCTNVEQIWLEFLEDNAYTSVMMYAQTRTMTRDVVRAKPSTDS